MEAIMQPPEMKPQELSIDKLFGLKGKVALLPGLQAPLVRQLPKAWQ
jgi:hypothetical protein